MKRRTFIKSSLLISTLSLDTFANTKTNSSVQLLSEFLKLFELKSHHFLLADASLKKSLKKIIQTSWKGYVVNQHKFFIIGEKAFCPIVLKNTNHEIIDCAVLCFEKIDNQWISLKSLSSFHLEGILNLSIGMSKDELAKTFLPQFSNEILPYSFKTQNGEFYIKATSQNDELKVEIMITGADNEAISNIYISKVFS